MTNHAFHARPHGACAPGFKSNNLGAMRAVKHLIKFSHSRGGIDSVGRDKLWTYYLFGIVAMMVVLGIATVERDRLAQMCPALRPGSAMDPIACATDTAHCGTGTVVGELKPQAQGILSSCDLTGDPKPGALISYYEQLLRSEARFNPVFSRN